MTIDVCTLFEGDYHYGVAALLHSLHNQGFKGRMFAGYRGALPDWARPAQPVELPMWPGASVLKVAPDCTLYFLPMTTSAHFTNIKPDFMLDLFAEQALSLGRLLYLDPDICLVRPWQFVGDWLSCGVTLCEDVNSPLSASHPRRIGWQRPPTPMSTAAVLVSPGRTCSSSKIGNCLVTIGPKPSVVWAWPSSQTASRSLRKALPTVLIAQIRMCSMQPSR